ncbi:hypothetical protein Bbelb_420880 [Branchiostoma belcheri]|nr:hypothetical protein Bbelb_420880 [Branchiostoma belcheri]
MTVYRVAVTEKKYRTFSCDQLQRRVVWSDLGVSWRDPGIQTFMSKYRRLQTQARSSRRWSGGPGAKLALRSVAPLSAKITSLDGRKTEGSMMKGRPDDALFSAPLAFDRQRSGEYSVSQAISSPGGLARTLQYSTRDRDWQVSGPSRRLLSVLVGT